MARTIYPSYRTRDERRMIDIRRSVLATTAAAVVPGYEAMDRAASLDFDQLAHDAIAEAFEHAGLDVDVADPRFTAAARYLLDRLRAYRLPRADELLLSFPTPDAIAPVNAAAESGPSEPSASQAAPAPRTSPTFVEQDQLELRKRILSASASARTLSEVFESWASEQPKEAEKLCDDWRVAIRRFGELFGDRDVADIDPDVVADFREAMKRLPVRPARHIKALPLIEQIDFAREHGLPTLAGPTVAKLVSGIRVTLDHACDPLRLIRTNPAAAVKVKGAKSDSDARLPFSPEDLQVIFADPMMTDPNHPSPFGLFWLLLLAVLTGMRIEEMGKLRPSNVRCERGIWYVAVERDSRRVRKERTASGKVNKVGKTESAYRHIALHWLLIEAGFVDFARRQEQAGHVWLFPEFCENKYGSRILPTIIFQHI